MVLHITITQKPYKYLQTSDGNKSVICLSCVTYDHIFHQFYEGAAAACTSACCNSSLACHLMSNMKSLASADTPLSCILCSLLWPICGGTTEDPPTRAKHSGSQKPLSHNITLQNRTRSYKLKLISLSPFSKVSHTL